MNIFITIKSLLSAYKFLKKRKIFFIIFYRLKNYTTLNINANDISIYNTHGFLLKPLRSCFMKRQLTANKKLRYFFVNVYNNVK